MTPEGYAAARHVLVSRKSQFHWPGRRGIVAIVPGFPDALRIARHSDLVALVPRSCLGEPAFREGLSSFELPVTTPEIAVSAMWHPRPAWLRIPTDPVGSFDNIRSVVPGYPVT